MCGFSAVSQTPELSACPSVNMNRDPSFRPSAGVLARFSLHELSLFTSPIVATATEKQPPAARRPQRLSRKHTDRCEIVATAY